MNETIAQESEHLIQEARKALATLPLNAQLTNSPHHALWSRWDMVYFYAYCAHQSARHHDSASEGFLARARDYRNRIENA